MKLHIAAIGSGRGNLAHELAEDWFGRIPQKNRGRIVEHVSKKPPGKERIADESKRISEGLPQGAWLVALDLKGKDISSEELAALISKKRDEGYRDGVFAIGGADGHAPLLLERADEVIAFGRATWQHMLVRAMLAEQLYRAESILAGSPYHRG